MEGTANMLKESKSGNAAWVLGIGLKHFMKTLSHEQNF